MPEDFPVLQLEITNNFLNINSPERSLNLFCIVQKALNCCKTMLKYCVLECKAINLEQFVNSFISALHSCNENKRKLSVIEDIFVYFLTSPNITWTLSGDIFCNKKCDYVEEYIPLLTLLGVTRAGEGFYLVSLSGKVLFLYFYLDCRAHFSQILVTLDWCISL